MLRRLVAVGVLGGLMWAAIIAPASAVQPSWVTTQVSTVIGANLYMGVSGDRIAWLDNNYVMPSTGRHIYTWEAGHGAPTVLDAGNITQAPQVQGDSVVWIHNDGSPETVYAWNASSETTSVVATSTANLSQLALSGDRLAWTHSGSDGEYVVTCAIDGTQARTLRVGTLQANGPQVSGDRVVWVEDNGSAYNVATWHVGDGAASWVTTSTTFHNNKPFVSGDRIAWKGQTDDIGGWAIYTKLATESAPTTLAVSDTYFDDGDGPCIAGDRVAWCQPIPGTGAKQVFTWSATDPVVRQVSSGPLSKSWVAVSEDRVAWIDVRRVMTWASGDTTASEVATAASPTSVGETRISGDRIVWRWNIGAGDYRVMTAVPSAPVIVPVATTLGKPTVSPSKPTHRKHAHFYAVLTPGAASLAAGGSTTMKLYRWESHYVTKRVRGHNRRVKVYYWHLRNSAAMTGTGSSATVRLTATITPKYAGKWKAVAIHSAGTGFLGSTSTHKDFTVK